MTATLYLVAEVISFEEARARLGPTAQLQRSPGHPALMWLVEGQSLGHRRIPGRGAACGASGPLVLAEPGAAPCRACYPLRPT